MKNEFASISATKGYIEWMKKHPSGLTVSGLMKTLIVKEILNPTPMLELKMYDYIQKIVRAETKQELEEWVRIGYEGVRKMGERTPPSNTEEIKPVEEVVEEVSIQEPPEPTPQTTTPQGKRQRRPVSDNNFNSMI